MKTKLLILFTLATFVVGVFLLPNSVVFAHEIAPWNVQINVNFNGKKYSYNLWENAKNLPQNQLENRGVFLGLKGKNNLVDSLVLRGFSYRESACFVLVGASRFLQQMQADQTQRRDAIARFCPQNFKKFDYQQGQDGIYLDIDATLQLMLSGATNIDAPTVVEKATTIEQLQRQTVLRSSCSTAFNAGNVNRVKNLQVCANKINGFVLLSGQIFSFNQVVGERTQSNGFFPAKVIMDGVYVDGVGGGVCQVATTLYNAVLLADLPVTTLYQHSLVSTYVPPSFDAMVSYPNADFCFANNTGAALYLHSFVQGNRLFVDIYGKPCPYQIECQSEVLDRLPAKTEYKLASLEDNLADGEQKVLTYGSDYVKSCAYLVYKKDGKTIKRVKIRQNQYKMSNKVVLIAPTQGQENKQG